MAAKPTNNSPWVSPTASQATLEVLANADAIATQPGAQGYGFVAFHGNGHVWLAQTDALGGGVHSWPTIEQAVGNSNTGGGIPFLGGGNTENFLEAAGNAISGRAIAYGSNAVVIAGWNVATKNDTLSQNYDPNGPGRRIILSATAMNTNISGAGANPGTPVTNTATGQTTTTPTQQTPAPNGLSGLAAIGQFFSDITNSAVWFRVIKIAAGVGLVAVGLTMLAESNKSVQAATKTVVSTAAKAAAL